MVSKIILFGFQGRVFKQRRRSLCSSEARRWMVPRESRFSRFTIMDAPPLNPTEKAER
jgi:hypothetical protein